MPRRYSAAFMTTTEVAEVIRRSSAALLPTIAAVYDDPDVLKANPFFADLKPVFQGGAVPRPSTVSSSSTTMSRPRTSRTFTIS